MAWHANNKFHSTKIYGGCVFNYIKTIVTPLTKGGLTNFIYQQGFRAWELINKGEIGG